MTHCKSRSLTGISTDAGANTQSFVHDALNRVVAAGGLTESAGYVYDADSNRVAVTQGTTTTTYTYDAVDQLVSRIDGGSPTYFAYDTSGNLTSSAVAFNQLTASTYDLGDRLTSITPSGTTTTTYTFDALGRAASRTTGGTTDSYRFVGDGDTVWRITTGAANLDTGIAADESRVALKTAGGVLGFTLPDLHGNAAALVNAANTAYLSATRYDAFGRTVASYDSGGSFPTPFGFQSRLDLSPDAADPLYAAGARFYSPNLGTFTQLDSFAGSDQDPLSLNRYLYAEANPWTLIDPSGHYAEASAGSGSQTIEQYRAGQVLRRAALARAALTTLHNHDVASSQIVKRDAGIDPFGVLGTAWNATGGQVVGFGQGLVGGGVDAVSGVATTAWQGGWWLYHSTAAYAFDNHAFNEQWDTNIAVGRYLKENPGEALSATWHGIVDPIADQWAAGNGGQASGRAVFEVGSVALGFGALAKAAKARFAVEGAADTAAAVRAAVDVVAPARTITVDAGRFGAAAEHMREVCGTSFCVTYDPAGAAARRAANMLRSGLRPIAGFDRDEAPMAIFREAVNASVRYVPTSLNRALGAYVGRNLQGLTPGDIVRIIITGGQD